MTDTLSTMLPDQLVALVRENTSKGYYARGPEAVREMANRYEATVRGTVDSDERIEAIGKRAEAFINSDDGYKVVDPEYIEQILIMDGYGERWSEVAAYSKIDIPFLISHLAATQAKLAEAERRAESQWTPISACLPDVGEKVEIARLTDINTAEYRPDENQHLPWLLIDYMPTGIWHRSAGAVTHWRRGPETKGGQGDDA